MIAFVFSAEDGICKAIRDPEDDATSVAVDMTLAIREFYQRIDDDQKEEFKMHMISSILSGIAFMSDGEICDYAEKAAAHAAERHPDFAEEMLKSTFEIRRLIDED